MRFLNFWQHLDELDYHSVGIFAGRFQPFHNGHASIIEHLQKNHHLSYVFVVSGEKSSKDTLRNPLPQNVRINLIENFTSNSNVCVLAANSPYIPSLITNVYPEINKTIKEGNSKVVVYSGDDRSTDYNRFVSNLQESGIDAEARTMNFDRDLVSGTKVRELLISKNFDEAQKYLPYDIELIKEYF